MSTGMDIQFVRETYQRLSDDELIHIATQDAYSLTAEAQEVVKEEIKKRKLEINITRGVDAQNKSYTIQEIDDYCDLIRSLTCPSCGTSLTKLYR